MRLHQILTRFWPLLTLTAIVINLFFTNYTPGTYLTGWDNLHPEYFFSMNIKRSIFAVWQEYQGLGLLGGMGHAADLVRQVFLLLLSFVLPASLLRYTWTFLMLWSGAIGAYYFIKYVLSSKYQVSSIKNLEPNTVYHIPNTIPFLGALFYLLNLATMQMFYAPFEAFIAHFGFLPWLLYASLLYYQSTTRKHLLFLAIVLLLATPQAYIPTLFVVYIMALSVIIGTLVLINIFCHPELAPPRSGQSPWGISGSHIAHSEMLKRVQHDIIKIAKLYLLIFLINAFWVLPFAYFTVTDVSVTINSKINQMATQSILDQNKAFGDIANVALLKGFWFENVDPNKAGDYDFMLKEWRTYVANPMIQLIGYLFFGVILLGVYKTIRNLFSKPFPLTPFPLGIACLALLLFALCMLVTATPPFSWINELFRTALPILNQAFRFPFTKFSILTALTYAIFFSFGCALLLQKIGHLKLEIRNLKFVTNFLFLFVFLSLFLLFSFPSFRGNFLYDKERLVIPPSYFQTFAYFQKQDPNTRIANLPQYTFWGWEYYHWGYGGSGFLWYGIRQPILDRAFDVWTHTGENYYYELTQAITSQNPQLLQDVLNKYQIGFLLVDGNVFDPGSGKTTLLPEFLSLIKKIPSIKKDATFDKIDIYKVALTDHPKSYVFTTGPLPAINAYTWTEQDEAYATLGNYISSATSNYQLATSNFVFPFRSLFSQKTQKDKEYSMKEKQTTIDLTSHVMIPSDVTKLTLPAMTTSEKIVPVTFVAVKNPDGTTTIELTLTSPTVFLGKTKIAGESFSQPIFSIPATASFPLILDINGINTYTITESTTTIGTTFFSLTQDNSIVISDIENNALQTQTISNMALQNLPLYDGQTIQLPPHKPAHLLIQVPKITDGYISFEGTPTNKNMVTNCNNFSENGKIDAQEQKNRLRRFVAFSASNATACIALYSSTALHDLGYGVFVDNTNVKGRGFHFWILNEDLQTSHIDTYLPSEKKDNIATFTIPPQENFGNAYSFHFENIAIGPDEVKNNLAKISMYPLPYNFLTNIIASNSPYPTTRHVPPATSTGLTVTHPNESLYTVSGVKSGQTIVLSQSFDKGWMAYAMPTHSVIPDLIRDLVPFLFGKKIDNHVMVNNWENGWVLPDQRPATNDQQLVIVYLPQYLEYLGFVLLIGTMTTVGILYLRGKKDHH